MVQLLLFKKFPEEDSIEEENLCTNSENYFTKIHNEKQNKYIHEIKFMKNAIC